MTADGGKQQKSSILLKTNTTFKKLILPFFPEFNVEEIHTFAEALKTNNTLRELEFSPHGKIGLTGETAFAEVLKINNTLRVLGLYGNGIGLAGWVFLRT